jgi:hypothetical protein
MQPLKKPVKILLRILQMQPLKKQKMRLLLVRINVVVLFINKMVNLSLNLLMRPVLRVRRLVLVVLRLALQRVLVVALEREQLLA